MSRENDARRDDWDEPQSGEYRPERTRPRQPRPRPSQGGVQQERGRQTPTPPARRRFTPARDTTGYQRQQPSQQRPASPAAGQRAPNPRRQPRGYRTDEEYEQYRRTESPRRRQPRDFRVDDEEYEQYQQRRRPEQPRRYPRHPRPPVYPREDDYYTVDTPAPGTRTRSASLTTPTKEAGQMTQQARPRRRGWSTLLIGCAGGFVTVAVIIIVLAVVVFHSLPNVIPGLNIGTSTYSDKQQSVSLPITTNTTRLVIQNPVGNVSVTTDSAATSGTLTYIKRTQATSQGNATAEFARIAIAVKPGSSSGCISATPASCLAVTTTLPNAGSDSVDMLITLPPQQNPATPFMLSSTTQKGNIAVQNFNGLLSLVDDTGNISVKGGLLSAGSCLQARVGNVTFAGLLQTATDKPPAVNPCTGTPVNPSGASNQQPWYVMKTGTGNIDVTFITPSASTQPINVLLGATIANQGKITSDFNIAVKQNSDGTSSYFGPLLPNAQPQPAALLILTVDVSGNITLHKA